MRQRGIPPVKTNRVRWIDTFGQEIGRVEFLTCTRKLAAIIARHDYPHMWGGPWSRCVISVVRKVSA